MNPRHQARLAAVQYLFQQEYRRGDPGDGWQSFWQLDRGSEDPAPEMQRYAAELATGVEAHLDELDQRLREYTEHWDLQRMGIVDRNVMRLALYELFFCPDIPPIVSVNEAVDLAKALSGRASGRFVNGILDRALQDVNRPLRSAGGRKKQNDE